MVGLARIGNHPPSIQFGDRLLNGFGGIGTDTFHSVGMSMLFFTQILTLIIDLLLNGLIGGLLAGLGLGGTATGL